MSKKILLVGARGTVGRGVAAELGQRHEIVEAGRSSAARLVRSCSSSDGAPAPPARAPASAVSPALPFAMSMKPG